MNVSARNVFKGKITALVNGAVNAEVALELDGGGTVVAQGTPEQVTQVAQSHTGQYLGQVLKAG